MKKIMPILFTIALFIILGITGWKVADSFWGSEPLSSAEAEQKILEQYSGEILEMETTEDTFVAVLENDAGRYQVELVKENGRITRLVRLSGNQSKQEADKEENIKKPESPEEDNQEPMTEEEARRLAVNEVSGSVDDVDKEQSNGQVYYLVEVERENGQEATVQVNAISGEIMSVTWDD